MESVIAMVGGITLAEYCTRSTTNLDMITKCDLAYREITISTLLILKGKSNSLLKKLDDALTLGNNAFPKKIPDAVTMMLKEEENSNSNTGAKGRTDDDDDAGTDSESTAAVKNIIVNPPSGLSESILDTSTGTSEDPTEEEDNARIVATLLLNSNYDRNDYFDDFDEEDESTVGPDDDYDDTNAHVGMVRATRNSNAHWNKVVSPTAVSMNRDSSSGNNPVTPIDDDIVLDDQFYEDDESDGMIETIDDSGTSSEDDVDNNEVLNESYNDATSIAIREAFEANLKIDEDDNHVDISIDLDETIDTVNGVHRRITNHKDGTITHDRRIHGSSQTRFYVTPPLSESWELSTFVADQSASEYKLQKGVYLFCMSFPHKSVEQREDLYTAYRYKIAAVGIFNSDTLLHTDLEIVNRRLSHRRFSKLTKNTYSSIQHYVTLSDSSGPAIQSIRSDSPLDTFADKDHHPELQQFLMGVAVYLKKLRPNLWCNKVYSKLILIGITTPNELKLKLPLLNVEFKQYSVPPLHRTTITVISQALTARGLVRLTSADFIEEFKSDFGEGGW